MTTGPTDRGAVPGRLEVNESRRLARRPLPCHWERLLTEHKRLDEQACRAGSHDVGVYAQTVGAAQHVVLASTTKVRPCCGARTMSEELLSHWP